MMARVAIAASMLAMLTACASYNEQGAIDEAERIASEAADMSAAEDIAFNPIVGRAPDEIDWSRVDTDAFDGAYRETIDDLRALVDTIAAQTGPATLEAVGLPFLEASDRLQGVVIANQAWADDAPEEAKAVGEKWAVTMQLMQTRVALNDNFFQRLDALVATFDAAARGEDVDRLRTIHATLKRIRERTR